MSAKQTVATGAIVLAALGGAIAYTQKNTPGLQSIFLTNNGTSGNWFSSDPKSIDQTVQSEPVNYMYGTVQLELVRKSGKISDVKMLQAGATNGREAAFPYLVKYAIQAQGTNFGNLTGATMTTDAFKQALESAISKLS